LPFFFAFERAQLMYLYFTSHFEVPYFSVWDISLKW
jgi:hypothetical protein